MKRDKKVTKGIAIGLWMPMIVVGCLFLIAMQLMDRFPEIAYGLCIGGVLYLIVSFVYHEYLLQLVNGELHNAGFFQSQIYKGLLEDVPIPYVLTSQKGSILWYNELFEQMVKKKAGKGNISQIFPALQKKKFSANDSNKIISMTYEGRNYDVNCRTIFTTRCPEGKEEELSREEEASNVDYFHVFYFFDTTQMAEYKDISEKKRLVAGLIYIDNYEEVLESMEDVRQSLILALVERKVVRYFQPMDAIVKRFERDKFIVVFQEKYLEQLLEDKFSLLDDVRGISIGNEIAMTLSISIGMNAANYMETYESARTAMDLALGRGGDQAVVKDGDSISYYGGKTQKVEKSTRVKARVKAHALGEMMLTHDNVFIMGHRIPDADCIGAALGIYRLAKTFDKNAYLVMNKDCPAIEPIVSQLKEENAAEMEEMFLTPEEAMAKKDGHTMLVVVDANVPSMTEAPGLLKAVKSIVLLDHHRQSGETIKNAVLSYIEPYASSSCEMVAEILQYVSTKPKLKPVEADALYSGILVDTDNFVVKAGVRTFEAAAYLRRMGADVTRVRKMFREDREHYMVRADIIHNAEIFLEEYAIAEFQPNGLTGATVVGAKAANELLNIQGIRGSFVITQLPEYIYISARSIDDLNVQVIMEKLGGGGHLTMAAAQIKEKSMEEAKAMLCDILRTMKEEGDI